MYKISHFTEEDSSGILAFMKENNFALVTGFGNGYPVATQLPLRILEDKEELYFTGHLMRRTDHHSAFLKNPKVLVMFTSLPAFIDAGWYKDPAVASTVNYMSVHAHGEIIFTDDAGTYEAIKQVTNEHVVPGSPGSFEKIPENYIDAMLKAIVGFRISVTSLEHVFKLSQNREKADQQNIITQLQTRGNAGDIFIANEMLKRI